MAANRGFFDSLSNLFITMEGKEAAKSAFFYKLLTIDTATKIIEHFTQNEALLHEHFGYTKCSLLHWAFNLAPGPRLLIIEFLLSKDVDVNAINKDGNPPLHLAANRLDVDAIIYLLNNGADFTIKNNKNKTPLNCIELSKIKDRIDDLCLFDIYIDDYDSSGMTLLHYFVMNQELDILEYFFEKHGETININIANKRDGTVPLHCAVTSQDDTKALAFLLKKGAEVNAVSYRGYTALHWAAQRANPEILSFLLQNGARVNAVDSNGGTALHWAVNSRHPNHVIETVRLLLANGADIIKDKAGESPVDNARQWKNIQLSAFFDQHEKKSALDDMWIMETATFTSFFQWLPREIKDDLEQIIAIPSTQGQSDTNTESDKLTPTPLQFRTM